jgi:hypothetical protein
LQEQTFSAQKAQLAKKLALETERVNEMEWRLDHVLHSAPEQLATLEAQLAAKIDLCTQLRAQLEESASVERLLRARIAELLVEQTQLRSQAAHDAHFVRTLQQDLDRLSTSHRFALAALKRFELGDSLSHFPEL